MIGFVIIRMHNGDSISQRINKSNKCLSLSSITPFFVKYLRNGATYIKQLEDIVAALQRRIVGLVYIDAQSDNTNYEIVNLVKNNAVCIRGPGRIGKNSSEILVYDTLVSFSSYHVGMAIWQYAEPHRTVSSLLMPFLQPLKSLIFSQKSDRRC